MAYIVVGCLLISILVREYVIYDLQRQYRNAEKDWAEERRELLNRIKPETAQIPNIDQSAIFDPVRNDEDFWHSHENLIKEEGTYPFGFEEENRGR